MNNVKNILHKFNFKGEMVDIQPFGAGHINKTYIATYKMEDGTIKQYVVQQVNSTVFKNIDTLMENVFAVTSFLRQRIKENGGDSERETLHYIKTADGDKYYFDGENYYRAYVFVDKSISYNSVDDAEIFKSSGAAFGKFQRLLADFPAETLTETIPNFHDTKWRYDNEFVPAVENNLSGRKDTCLDEIQFVMDRQADTSVLVDLIKQGELPIRVTHNDTKLNNVIFDEATNKGLCVIDLDTVMPGLALYDFGDSIRFGANTACEDEADLDKVSLNLEYFKAYAQGFLSEAGEAFNQCEIDNFAFASKLMTFECGMRFLTDYLNGDVYFNTAYPEHNLVRARNQFKLVADMEDKMSQMKQIIADITN